MPSISPMQVRAARAMLDWSMLDLAKAAKMSISTVKRFEVEASAQVKDRTVGLMRDALEAEGVRFLPDEGNGLGVRCGCRQPARLTAATGPEVSEPGLLTPT